MTQLTKHFCLEELLPHGHTDASVLDKRLLALIDQIRDLLGVPCEINADGRQLCGWRPADCPVGAPHSQHKLGKAADIHPQGMTAEEARAKVKAAVARGELPLLGGVELGVSWLHVDVRDRVNGKVLWFKA